MGLWETAWGKMSVITVGSFQVFIKKLTLARVLQVKVHVFPKTSIFIFSLQAINSSSEDRYGEPLIFVGYRISNRGSRAPQGTRNHVARSTDLLP